MRAARCAALMFATPHPARGHGQLNLPPSRNLGTLERAGRCNHQFGTCSWFSHLVGIPGEPTLPHAARTYNVDVTGGPRDYSRGAPWRAPGAAPVHGSGCGVMGGGETEMPIDGAVPGGGHAQGFDGAQLPPLGAADYAGALVAAGGANADLNGEYRASGVRDGKRVWVADNGARLEYWSQSSKGAAWWWVNSGGRYVCAAPSAAAVPPAGGWLSFNATLKTPPPVVSCAAPCDGAATQWRRGEVAEVAWGCGSNHGGGYSYRLCRKGGDVSEGCFQRNVLRFSGNSSWLQRGAARASRVEIPLFRVTEGTYPAGSEWARNPVPSCRFCDIADCNITSVEPNTAEYIKAQECAQTCAGGGGTKSTAPNQTSCSRDAAGLPLTQFDEPRDGVSGYLWLLNFGWPAAGETWGASFSIVDRVLIPAELAAGDYLLSWRWDAEGTRQVWQNCADVTLV